MIIQLIFEVCLVGNNSESGRLVDAESVSDSALKYLQQAGLESPLKLLLQKAERLADFKEILVFICETLRTR